MVEDRLAGRPSGSFPSAVVEYSLTTRSNEGRPDARRPSRGTHRTHDRATRARTTASAAGKTNKTTKYKHSRGWNGCGSVEFTLLNRHQNSSGVLYLGSVDTVTTGVSTYLSTPVSTHSTHRAAGNVPLRLDFDHDGPKRCGSSHAVAQDRACFWARAWPR